MKQKLVVIGGGEMLDRIRKLAGPTVTVLGPRPFAELRHHYARCRALVFPGEEDFGIVPVEAMASGRPVIAFGRGGTTETVVPNVSGVLFPEQTVEALIEAIWTCTATDFNPVRIAAHAQQFSRARFTERMTVEIERLCGDRALDRLAPEVTEGGRVEAAAAAWKNGPPLAAGEAGSHGSTPHLARRSTLLTTDRPIDTDGLAEKERAAGY